MASMRDIKRRKASIQSTQQITKAMKLVSTVKLQKAKQRAENTNPYFNYMYSTVTSILARSGGVNHPCIWNGEDKGGKTAVVVITSNRGLAGGYNNNIVKLVSRSEELPVDDTLIYSVGSKGRDGLARLGYEIMTDRSDVMEAPLYEDAASICNDLLKKFETGEVDKIYLAYTHFKNTVVHEPTLMQLLPVAFSEEEIDGADKNLVMNFEPAEDETLDLIIPKYLSSLFYGALIEAVASENGARMQAMDSATSNAEDIISDLSLKYNRARQGSITQELTEIIAGAEAIS